jgi:hypothetical protein
VALQNAYLRNFHRKRHAYSFFSRHTYRSRKWLPCLLSGSLPAVLWSHEYSHACAFRYTSTVPNSVTAANRTHEYMEFLTQKCLWN